MYLFGLVFHRSISEELVWFGWYTLKEFNGSKLQTAIFVKPQDKKKKKRHKADLDYISEEITLFSLREDYFSNVFLSKSKFRSKKCIKLQKKDCNKKLPWSALYVVNYFVHSQNMRTSCCRPHIYLVKFIQMTLFFILIVPFQSCCSFRTQRRWSRLIKSADSSSTTWPLTPSGLEKVWPGERPRLGEKLSLFYMPSKHQDMLIWSKLFKSIPQH